MIGVTLQGVDGSIWDLRQGPILLAPGVEGFGLPNYERATVEAANLDGQRLQGIGSRAKARSGLLPCLLTPQTTEAAWLALQRAWWAAWSPDAASTITVTDPTGGTRSIAAYLDKDDGYGLELEPTINLFERVPVAWIADNPWWHGPEISTTVVVPTGGDWLAGGTAPPFQFQAAATTGAGTLTNPGEQPAWPRYTIGAGTATFSITVNGQTTAGSIAVPDGGRLVIDTSPDAQTALLILTDGTTTNVTPQLTAIGFAPVPVGGNVPVTTALTGSNGASITATLRPRYRRAF